MNKIYNIGIVKLKMQSNGFPEGFLLHRQLNIRECKHILKNLLGIQILTLEDCYDKEEYNEYNQEIVSKVNGEAAFVLTVKDIMGVISNMKTDIGE